MENFRGKQYSTPKIVFLQCKSQFFYRKKLEIPFSQWKRWFSNKKTRFNIANEVFLVENSALHQKQYFYSVKVSFSTERIQKSCFSSGKDGFLRKIQDLTSKTRLCSWKIVLYTKNSILQCKSQFFYRKKLERQINI